MIHAATLTAQVDCPTCKGSGSACQHIWDEYHAWYRTWKASHPMGETESMTEHFARLEDTENAWWLSKGYPVLGMRAGETDANGNVLNRDGYPVEECDCPECSGSGCVEHRVALDASSPVAAGIIQLVLGVTA